jgi:hypothetical protein
MKGKLYVLSIHDDDVCNETIRLDSRGPPHAGRECYIHASE